MARSTVKLSIEPAVSCGIDWASDHHDIALVDAAGDCVAKERVGDDVAGLTRLLEILAEHGDSPQSPLPIAIETPRGLLVAALRAAGRTVYPINPVIAARYRERRTVTGRKSDHLDAMVLANILRTDLTTHRPLPQDSAQARAITVLARAQQDTVWERTRTTNTLRGHLLEYFPAFLTAFAAKDGGLARADARTILAAAPTPTAAALLSIEGIIELLREAGRTRLLRYDAERLFRIFHDEQLRQPAVVEQAMGTRTQALLRQLDAVCTSACDLEEAAVAAFRTHPDHAIITSFPGLGELTGSRLLAELGDDHTRFADARGLKAYAGAAPITRASGKTTSIKSRWIKNNRLAATGYVWAFASLTASPGARAHYDRRREAGDWHIAAQRNLFNRFLGCLHHCLTHRTPFDETTAFPTPTSPSTPGQSASGSTPQASPHPQAALT